MYYNYDNKDKIEEYFELQLDLVMKKFMKHYGINEKSKAMIFLKDVMKDYEEFHDESTYYNELKKLDMDEFWISSLILDTEDKYDILIERYNEIAIDYMGDF